MKHYVFSFYTDQKMVREEAILANGMMDAFLKAKKAMKAYKKELGVPIRVQYKGVRYRNIDIA
ncbi:hypothetical protein [Anoxybacteroides amylolyticum]|uniref:Uncharacterized protein n=1 Tax=Anoxybacteroides amylolyticum TaxID=294699 RepID=A0A161HY82_9BACL|nr:hypothetical protein [Anoxybacillus amylolyticus]ANB60130.1 hypothetical protein GFC30_2052 [Anoxybacillus amylolyticus]